MHTQAQQATQPCTLRPHPAGRLARDRVAELLGAWQQREVQRARRAWRWVSVEELEDIYQDTTLALLEYTYDSPEHLRNALWTGMRYRALNARRDGQRRTRIWAGAIPGLQALAEAKEREQSAEPLVLAREDQRIATEFLATLNHQEQDVYWLMTQEGWGHISIAAALGIPANQARNTMNACERKRARFQTLYTAGRLCGYRAQTIQTLEQGVASTEDLARQALAHLQNCPTCHTAHSKLARNLHKAFQRRALERQIAVTLPTPVLAHQLSRLGRLAVHARSVPHRLNPTHSLPRPKGTMGERAAALLNNGSPNAAAKAARGMALLTVLATGTLGVKHFTHHPASPRQPSSRQSGNREGTRTPQEGTTLLADRSRPTTTTRAREHRPQGTSALPFGPGYALPPGHPHRHTPAAPAEGREAGGFAYLGVPAPPRPRPPEQQTERPGGGGEFSP